MKTVWIWFGAVASTLLIAGHGSAAIPLKSTTNPLPTRSDTIVAGFFDVLDIAEDVDDLLDGDIGKIDPIQNFTRDVEDAFDDVNDAIDDIGDNARDSVKDIDDTIDDISDDINDWFD